MAAHRYWRLYITAVNGGTYASMGEFELLDAGATDLTAGKTATASSQDGSDGPSKAIDDNNESEWISANGSAAPSWLRVDLGTAQDVVNFSIRCQRAITDRAPKNFELQYSDDDAAWTTSGSVVNETGWAAYEKRTFSATASSGVNEDRTVSGPIGAPGGSLPGAKVNVRDISGSIGSPGGSLAAIDVQSPPVDGLVTLPALQSYGTAIAGYIASGVATLPALRTTGTDTGLVRGTATLTAVRTSGTATSTAASTGQITLPAIRTAGVATSGSVASGVARLATIRVAGTMFTTVLCTGRAVLPAVETSGVAFSSAAGSGLVTLPLVSTRGVAVAGAVASGRAVLPAVIVRGADSEPTTVVTVVVVNTVTGAVTHYADWDFNSVVQHGGKVYGASDAGFFELDVEGAEVLDYEFRIGRSSLGSEHLKTIQPVYLTGDLADVEVLASTDNSDEYAYACPDLGLTESNQVRTMVGRGLRGKSWTLGVRGSHDKFRLESMTAGVLDLQRKIHGAR